jgi:hypothetical protein
MNQLGVTQTILNRHASAPCQRLQRCVRGIAQEDNATFVPVTHWIAVGDRASPAEVHHIVERTHRWVSVVVNALQLGTVGLAMRKS